MLQTKIQKECEVERSPRIAAGDEIQTEDGEETSPRCCGTEVTVDIPEEDQEETVQEVAKSTVSPATKYMVRAEPGNERSSSESETESNIDVEGQPKHEKEEGDEEQHEGPKISDEPEDSQILHRLV